MEVGSGGRKRALHSARVVALLSLPVLSGSDCSLVVGSGDLPVHEIVVVPSAVELPAGAQAGIEAIGRDRLGGRVEVRVTWVSADPEVATVTPDLASHTVITAVAPGETRVVAKHRFSGARDTVEVTVIAKSLPSPVIAWRRLDFEPGDRLLRWDTAPDMSGPSTERALESR